MNAVFDYVQRQMQNEKSNKDKQAAARQRKLNNFKNLTVEDSDDKLERQLDALEEGA